MPRGVTVLVLGALLNGAYAPLAPVVAGEPHPDTDHFAARLAADLFEDGVGVVHAEVARFELAVPGDAGLVEPFGSSPMRSLMSR